MTPENQRDEEIKQKCAFDISTDYASPKNKDFFEADVKKIQDLLASERQSWEREKLGLKTRILNLEQNGKEELTTLWKNKAENLEAEKKGLEERVKNLQDIHRDYIQHENSEITRLKAENERLKNKDFVAEAVKQVEASDSMYRQQCLVIRQKIEQIDTLTHALAEARGFMTEIIKEHKENEGEIFYLCQPDKGDVFSKYDNIAVIAKDALSNPTSQRASEEMKGLRKVVEAARLSNKECRKWRSNPDEKPCHEFKSLVDNDLLCHGCRLMNRIEALEAYESRGKVCEVDPGGNVPKIKSLIAKALTKGEGR